MHDLKRGLILIPIILIGRIIDAYDSFVDEHNVFRLGNWLDYFEPVRIAADYSFELGLARAVDEGAIVFPPTTCSSIDP